MSLLSQQQIILLYAEANTENKRISYLFLNEKHIRCSSNVGLAKVSSHSSSLKWGHNGIDNEQFGFRFKYDNIKNWSTFFYILKEENEMEDGKKLLAKYNSLLNEKLCWNLYKNNTHTYKKDKEKNIELQRIRCKPKKRQWNSD